jgi:4-hydroxy-3-methylbut-2-enyl diphosphate reductase IspH
MDEVRALGFSGVRELGVTSGASTPESFFREAVSFLRGPRETAEYGIIYEKAAVSPQQGKTK